MSDNQSIVSVDLNELGMLVENGKDILFTPTAESALLRLLELEEMVDRAIDNAKEMIRVAAEKYNPNFSSVQSDKIKVMYRYYGGKYEIDINVDPATIDPDLVELKTTYTLKPGIVFNSLSMESQKMFDKKVSASLVSKEIDKRLAKEDSMPKGIVAKPRVKQMSIKRIEDVVEDDI